MVSPLNAPCESIFFRFGRMGTVRAAAVLVCAAVRVMYSSPMSAGRRRMASVGRRPANMQTAMYGRHAPRSKVAAVSRRCSACVSVRTAGWECCCRGAFIVAVGLTARISREVSQVKNAESVRSALVKPCRVGKLSRYLRIAAFV